MQQTVERPWAIPIDRIFIDLGNLARLPDQCDGSSGVGNVDSDEDPVCMFFICDVSYAFFKMYVSYVLK